MSDIRQCTRAFLTEFIELYKSLPCLWKVSCRDYNDRNKKNKAYQVLIDKYREIDSNATRDTVTKKINSLRTNYRKEVIKVTKSEQNGGEYRPSLWYYDLLEFLTDQDLSRMSMRASDDINESCSESYWEYSGPITETDRLEDESSTLMGQSNQSSEYEYSRAYPTLGVSKGPKRSASEGASANDKDVRLVADKLRCTDYNKVNSNVSFGKYVTDELNNMPPEMVPHVKKIINLAIFEGNMKTLNATSSIKTCPNLQTSGHCSSAHNCSENSLSTEHASLK